MELTTPHGADQNPWWIKFPWEDQVHWMRTPKAHATACEMDEVWKQLHIKPTQTLEALPICQNCAMHLLEWLGPEPESKS